MFACSGVRLPLRLLQRMHAQTRLVQLSLPPSERGTTWSVVMGPLRVAQY